jgi:ferritin-like metal-binding protein YciE
MKIWTTREAFCREVGALYDAKRRFLEAHEEMAAVASDPQLARCLRQHLAQIGQQIAHLDSISQLLSEQETVVTSHAARGLARDVHEIVDAAQTNEVRDWVIATAVGTIGHTELAFYTGLVAMAQHLELSQQVLVLLPQDREQDQQALWSVEGVAPRLLQAAVQRDRDEAGRDVGTQGGHIRL